ncbi:MAG: alpha/beta fold hydrolase [Pseudomonadota bacterium]
MPKPTTARLMFAAIAFVLVGCSERGVLEVAMPDPSATTHTIWVSNFRSDVQANASAAPPRPMDLSFEAINVSVPATHAPGQIEWPEGPPDASTDFVTVGQRQFETINSFTSNVARSDQSRLNETLVFVHGYNTRHAEAVYQLAQFVHDFNVPVPPVLFSWPSAGLTIGYVYDRDSALLARDELEATLLAMTRNGRKVVLVGHSMGSYLIMETLRQIALKGSMDIDRDIASITLMAPDVDGELFREQAETIGDLPTPFLIMVAEQDGALRISSLLTGRRPRLGAQTDRSIVGDLPITVVDVSDLATGGAFNHKIATTSPSAIAILRGLAQQGPPGTAPVGALVVLSQLAL